jgi:hypothetical protein
LKMIKKAKIFRVRVPLNSEYVSGPFSTVQQQEEKCKVLV